MRKTHEFERRECYLGYYRNEYAGFCEGKDMIFSRALLVHGLCLAAASAQPRPAKPVSPISRHAAGQALKEYDPVAYFEVGKAMPGSTEFSHEINGTKFLFRSEASKALFVADPAKYLPQYGGYCGALCRL